MQHHTYQPCFLGLLYLPSTCLSIVASTGGITVGKLLLGGVDPALAAGPFISTPLQPNVWRSDFITGKNMFVFWQFTPKRISIIQADGRLAHLCNQPNLKSRRACTVIADTGYDSIVVGPKRALTLVQAATSPSGLRCATAIQVGWVVRHL